MKALRFLKISGTQPDDQSSITEGLHLLVILGANGEFSYISGVVSRKCIPPRGLNLGTSWGGQHHAPAALPPLPIE